MRHRSTQGQSTLEYAFLLAIIIAAVITMQVYVRRGMMGRMKETAEGQIGAQFDPYRTTGGIKHSSDGTTTDDLKTDGTSSSSLNITSQREEYVGAGETVQGYDPTENLFSN